MILIIDDDIAVRTSLSLLLRKNGYEIATAPGPKEALEWGRIHVPTLVIMDMNFSVETSGEEGLALLKAFRQLHTHSPIILITGWGSIELAVAGMRAGASDFIHKPWNNDHVLHSVKTALSLSAQNQAHSPISSRKKLDEQFDFSHIIGEDPALLEILGTIGRVSKTEASILVQGESGTGKELIAEAVHRNSRRSNQPFIKVNLGGISASLFESEMFGHKKGAFTDAREDRIGRFGLADKGTIFLDEIGDLDLNSQVKLLRVLQDRTYEVLGDSRTRTVDVRVICATNKDLAAMVEKGNFREDLFYRINLITVKLPALRERSGDIPLLVAYFLANLSNIYHRDRLSIHPKAVEWLSELPLSGNIRELKNLVERTVLVSEKDLLKVEDFTRHLQNTPRQKAKNALPAVGAMTLEEMEVAMIQKALTFHKRNLSKVAKSLGLSRAALYRRLDKYQIDYESPN